MDNLINNNLFHVLLLMSFCLSLVLYIILYFSGRADIRLLRKLIYIPARKSNSGAIQLGGAPYALTIFIILACVIIGNEEIISMRPFELSLLKKWVFAAAIIFVYGYLDDKYELRPIVKLIGQVIAVTFFGIFQSQLLMPEFASVAFLVCCFWGLGAVNGTNLLDGLDTMTIKLSAISFSSLIIMGHIFNYPFIMELSVLFFIPLVSFYLFNMEPAKIHLGEIGGSFIGFVILLQCSLLFGHLHQTESAIFSAGISLVPLTLPMSELAVSFLRRLVNRKSPFKGDKLHSHHILKNYYHLRAAQAATYLSIAYALIMAVTLILGHFVHPFIALICQFSLHLCAYIICCGRYWMSDDSIQLNPKSLFEYLRKKDVLIIESKAIDDFKITILAEGEEQDIEMDKDDSSINDDKESAA